MTTLKEYFSKGPEVCGVSTEIAEEYARHLGALFIIEKNNHESQMARKSDESVTERMELAYEGWSRFVTNPDVFDFFADLGNFAAASYGFNKYAIGDKEELAEIKAYLQSQAELFPEVTDMMTVEEASMVGIMTSWD